jgi:ApbE superfamily uncharacterized protein (UPF0280 family)
MNALAALLPDGRRLHLQHGPIDLIVEAWGEAREVAAAYRQTATAFGDVLPGLVRELPLLRSPLSQHPDRTLKGPVAQRMQTACMPYAAEFITPMAAVAGAVADHVLAAMLAGRNLAKGYVNDGGDIAFHLTPGEKLTCGVVGNLRSPAIDGTVTLTADMPVRGIATSGAATKGSGGRSFSLGIADAVTVLAESAAAADAAATMIANAVDLPGHPAIRRAPASGIDPDSDLGGRPITLAVGKLSHPEIHAALVAGAAKAEALRAAGLIFGAVLLLRGHHKICSNDIRLLRAA